MGDTTIDYGALTLGEVISRTAEQLLEKVEEVSLPCCKYLASYYPDARVRRAYLRRIGVVFADDSSYANIGFTVIPNSPSDVHVRVGKNVSIAPNVTCVCDSCANNGVEINKFAYVRRRVAKRADIVIDDEAWIGAGVCILPGVTIGRCAIVGAGCVVTGDVEPYAIYAGVPGRKVGDVRKWESGFESE